MSQNVTVTLDHFSINTAIDFPRLDDCFCAPNLLTVGYFKTTYNDVCYKVFYGVYLVTPDLEGEAGLRLFAFRVDPSSGNLINVEPDDSTALKRLIQRYARTERTLNPIYLYCFEARSPSPPTY